MREYVVECQAIGTLKKLKIRHNNAHGSPGWFLDKIIVDDFEARRIYEFPCGRWLATDEDDHQISRELACVGWQGTFKRFLWCAFNSIPRMVSQSA